MKDLWGVLARQRDYRLVLSAGLISLTGDWLLRTGLAFQVYVLTGSTLASGGLLLASFAPTVLLGSLAGVFVDRWDQRRTMIVANLLNAAVLLPLLFVRDASVLWIVYAVVLAQACLQQFFQPAEQSVIPLLVPSEQLITANALNSQIRDVARLVGAAVGGLLAAVGGLPLLAVADAAALLIAATLLSAVRHRTTRVRELTEAAGSAVRRLRTEWIEGLRLCVGGSAMRLLFVFCLVTGLGEGVMSTLFAPFVSTELGGDGKAYGLIVSAQAVGGIVGGLVAASLGTRLRAATMWGVGALLFGVIDLVLFCYPLVWDSLAPAFVCMIAVGLPGAFAVAGMMTVLQRLTTDGTRGRVFGAVLAAKGLTVLIGIAAAGLLGEVVGIIPLLIFQGLGYVGGGVVILSRRRLLETRAADPAAGLPSPV
ncbi:MFS transporter [Kribbella sandramycini]|uniref:MFS transporter n=1 Tax=Kribbella sandramycini TaxID=60450 RepID=A0A7Y4L734_9ACTN|nr:MFS transporter [Kribbella sandramycini]MBB6566870.1 Na+/melibiose symporter-like transporter [Kribbella sandramycini]NOL44592.1 MFS transporter [Kribbella sandramycini]